VHLDLRKPLAQPGGEPRVELDRDDAAGATRERRSQNAGSGSEIEYEVARLNARSANQLRCKLATAEKVLAAAAT
jgi:hypothetical protein